MTAIKGWVIPKRCYECIFNVDSCCMAKRCPLVDVKEEKKEGEEDEQAD